RPPRLRKLSLSTHAALPRHCDPDDALGEMHLTAGAWMGLARVSIAGNICNVTLVVSSRAARGAFVSGPRDARLNAFVDHWQPRFPLLAGDAPLRPLGGERWMASGPFDVPVRNVAFDGVALVGDAAGYFDPFTGQ